MPQDTIRSKRLVKQKGVLKEATPPLQYGESEDFLGVESDDPMEKDENELQLERMVFGDEAGFQSNLRYHAAEDDLVEVEHHGEIHEQDFSIKEERAGLEGVADTDVGPSLMIGTLAVIDS